ncbi:HTH-type transcriptional regulator/antitoxin HipB [Nocardioides sp. BE266]|uniref:helix-turn-helix domain-containing protein n=1 Tax=Nocardioides sp. BE266 TaxID=2817725 RepID=UPI00285AF747|nr:helix-turn-helix transcriptional regulator [Nocardioides sp. BE266]MDR7251699.1 HTH-type transcriptional regulator/antitoxin HipB [Nocardioides sp. BE266]
MTISLTRVDPAEMADWTEAEVDHYLMGPFDGEIPGLVRRIRRILDVSQRGLAKMLGISQSQVARWETRRTSPRATVLLEMLRLAGLRLSLHDQETGKEVEPMRDDGGRDRARRRYPAHVDLEVTGWWAPRDAMMTGQGPWWRGRSRKWEVPSVRYHHRRWKRILRDVYGTPVDHPARHQLVAEAFHLDELREERRLRAHAIHPPGTTPIAAHGRLGA